MENNTNIPDLLKNIPKELLGKISVSSNISGVNQGNIEVVILFGESGNKVRELVSSLGGEFEDLGYGFGIVDISLDKLLDLARSPYIQYLELPKSLYYSDEASNRACCVDRARSEYGLQGEGVVVGFIDTGIDYTHPAFLNDDGTTRIEYIYDLTLNKQIYDKEKINEALKSNNPLSIVPSYDLIEHGTHVAGIACAGGKIDPQYYGVAPKSSIMMVKSGRGLFSLSTNILRGISFLIEKSREIAKPLVINISLSTNDGAHNGTSLLEQYISTISKSERVTIVIAAGNEGNASHHISGDLNDTNNIQFEVAEDETAVVLNLYKSVLPQVSLELIAPTGVSTGIMTVKEGFMEGVVSGNRYRIYNTGPTPFDISGEIGISLITDGNYILSGTWSMILRKVDEYSGLFDIWLPISEGLNKKTKFLQPTIDNTLGIPATVSDVISVGSYNYITRNISPFSGRGRGYPLYLIEKPELVAPGEGITSSVPNRSFDVKSGTSMATPHVSGISALLMEWGIVKENDVRLFGERLKYYLVIGAKKERRDISYPDPSWGYGEVCLYDTLSILKEVLNILNTQGNFRQNNINYKSVSEYRNRYLQSSDVVGFLVEYATKDSIDELNKLPNVSAITINESFALVYAPLKDEEIIQQYVKNVIKNIIPNIFTLNDISPIEDANVLQFQKNEYLTLNGRGVLIAVLDTGIDYLNSEFIKEDDTTRIVSIWDQTLTGDKPVKGLNLGKEFSSDEINAAIKLKNTGGDPYSIVESKDEVGHGTIISSIAAARGNNPDVVGVAPNSELIVVKVKPESTDTLALSAVTKPNVLAYGTINLMAAINYVSLLSSELKRPIVILLAMGSNYGSHDGTEILANDLDTFTAQVGALVATGTGNEGDTDTHTEGVINLQGEERDIEVMVGNDQRTLSLEIWINRPDIMSISITSPSGEKIERIPVRLDNRQEVKFVYEGTSMEVSYILSNRATGDENISIIAINLKPGVWKFTLYGDYIVTGKYYAWLPQRALLDEDTKFLQPSIDTTLMNPASANKVLSVAYYNQNNNTIVPASGRGYTRDGRIKPDIAAAGINAKAVGINGRVETVSGSSVATSIAAGICALLLQWTRVDGNNPDIFSEEIISYIIRGARMRKGDTYPNKEWGYGIIDLEGIINAISGDFSSSRCDDKDYDEYEVRDLFIRIPNEFFNVEVDKIKVEDNEHIWFF